MPHAAGVAEHAARCRARDEQCFQICPRCSAGSEALNQLPVCDMAAYALRRRALFSFPASTNNAAVDDGRDGRLRPDAGAHPAVGGQPPCAYFAVGITNSAPLPIDSGQRCITLFCRV